MGRQKEVQKLVDLNRERDLRLLKQIAGGPVANPWRSALNDSCVRRSFPVMIISVLLYFILKWVKS